MGSRLGPEAIRLAGLLEALRSLGEEVCDRGDMARPRPATAPGGLRNFAPLADCVRDLRQRVSEVLAEGSIPMVLGGEHTIALGCVSAALAAHSDLALLWIDAHADLNVPGTSITGNLHGMPIAALWGLDSRLDPMDARDPEWRQLLQIVGPNRLAPYRTAWYALRDVDLGEKKHVAEAPGSLCLTMHEIDRLGISAAVAEFDRWMRENGARHLWISFDVDALDPVLAPGTGTAVRGGLSYREAHLTAELLHELMNAPDCPYRLVGVDLVETSPVHDTGNMTALMAVEWAASLFGKTVLGHIA
jgi:arginase